MFYSNDLVKAKRIGDARRASAAPASEVEVRSTAQSARLQVRFWASTFNARGCFDDPLSAEIEELDVKTKSGWRAARGTLADVVDWMADNYCEISSVKLQRERRRGNRWQGWYLITISNVARCAGG